MDAESSLIGMIDNFLRSKDVKLPAFNATAHRIQKEIAKEEPNSGIIERLIVSDQSLTGEVLRVSNSSFYKGLTQITTVRDAIIRLGIEEVSNIATMVTLQHNFRSKNPTAQKIMGKLWRHSVGCAIGANWLARQSGFHAQVHEAFIAGLLHDVGKLLILKVLDDLKVAGKIANQPSDELLDEVMRKLHTDQGYALMILWNLPEKYCQIARDHHIEDFDCNNLLMVLVRLANHMCHKIGIGLRQDPSLVLMATPEAKQLQLSEVDLARLEVRLEDSQLLA